MKKLKTPITVSGVVIHGERAGRKINFPTANLDIDLNLEAEQGVYFTRCQLNHKSLLGLAYFGPRYLVNQTANSFEVYLIGFNQNIYGQTLTVTLTHFLRPPMKFTSLEEARKQILKDLQAASSLFNN